NAGKTFGSSDPNPLTTGSGGATFVASDGVTATYSRASGETVLGGPYHLIATLTSSNASALGNYTITNAGASFAISPYVETGTVATDLATQFYTGPITFTAKLPITNVGSQPAATSVS